MGNTTSVQQIRHGVRAFFSHVMPGALLPALTGVFLTIGYFISSEICIPLSEPRFFVALIVQCSACVLLFAGAYEGLAHVSTHRSASRNSVTNNSSPHTSSSHISSPRRPLLLRIIMPSWKWSAGAIIGDGVRISACWLPWVLLAYPGLRGFDSGDMIAQWFGLPALQQPAGTIWMHHPWLDTALYGTFAQMGRTVFGSVETGLFLLTILQMLVGAFSFAVVLAWFAAQGLRRSWLGFWTVFICFFPLFPLSTAGIVKDSTHAVVLILWTLLFFMIVRSGLAQLRSPWFFTLFIVWSVLFCLTLKTGPAVMACCLLFALFIKSRHADRLLLVMSLVITTLIAQFALPAYMKSHYDMREGNVSAALVVPIHMLSRVAHEHPEAATTAEKKALEGYFTYSWKELGDRYNPFIGDMLIDSHGNGAKFGMPSKQAIRAWARIGRRYPKEYVIAFLEQESGWFSLVSRDWSDKPDYIQRMRKNIVYPIFTEQGSALDQITGPLTLSQGSMAARDGWMMWTSTPLLDIPTLTALYTFILPIFLVYALFRSRRDRRMRELEGAEPVGQGDHIAHPYTDAHPNFYADVCAMLPFIMSAVVLYASAVSQSSISASAPRYAVPAIFAAPCVMCWLGLVLQGKGGIRRDLRVDRGKVSRSARRIRVGQRVGKHGRRHL